MSSRFTRRSFLATLALGAGAAASAPLGTVARTPAFRITSAETTDEEICLQKFTLAAEEELADKPIGDVMVAIGRSFLGTPYLAHALEAPGDERLIVNLRGLDCVTFCETTLALSRCIKLGKPTFADYQSQLTLIRYRSGAIAGYPSRLHYFSDWIDDNETKKTVRNVTREVGGSPFVKTLNFMSSHPSSYRQLAKAEFLQAVSATEQEINGRHHAYLPKEAVASRQASIREGDIIGITTSIEGLDIIHTGMAIRVDGILKYLHAPLSDGKVQITTLALPEYLASHKNQTGIMVARPLEPARVK
jgi:hypothetical protein